MECGEPSPLSHVGGLCFVAKVLRGVASDDEHGKPSAIATLQYARSKPLLCCYNGVTKTTTATARQKKQQQQQQKKKKKKKKKQQKKKQKKKKRHRYAI